MGASAQECSAFSPMVPFLKTIRLKDLSNHLSSKRSPSVRSLPNRNKNTLTPRSPPVVALPVKQRLGVTVQRSDGVVGIESLLCVIQGDEEGRLLNGVQRLLVLATAEVSVTSDGPWGPAGQKKSANGGRGLVRTVFPTTESLPPVC